MAGTDDDNTTSDDAWWFLSPSLSRLAKPDLVFVTQWTWHEKPAKEFLWDGAADGSIRWYAEIEILEDNPVFKTRAGLLTFNTAVNRGLWHPAYFSMNWETNEGIYAGPAILLKRNPECPEQVGLFYDGRASVRIMARLMRFHHGDVVRELCRRGLMPWPVSEPASSPEVPVASPPSSQAPATPTAPAENSEWPSAQALGIEGDWQQQAILASLPELYAKHPESFGDGKVYRHGGSRLASAVGKLWAAKAGGTPPSEDTAGRFLKAYRAWAANQRA
jgi:hypothetical protein